LKKTFADNLLQYMESLISYNVIQDVHVFLSLVEKKLRFLMKTFQDFSPYNTLQWSPNGPKDTFSTNCKLFEGL